MKIIRIDDIEAQPWKNGAGATRTIAVGPGWRVSIARVTQDGPFSVFEGTGRHSIVLEGGPLHLSHARASVHLQRNAFSSYPGDVAWECRLEGGAATVLNIMCERGLADVDILIGRTASFATFDGDTVIALPVDADAICRMPGTEIMHVRQGSVLVAAPAVAIRCAVASSEATLTAHLIAARLHPTEPGNPTRVVASTDP